MNIISSWDSLTANGTPDEYVVFATCGAVSSPFDDEVLTATATIGQRDKGGWLFQNRLHSRHFCPRKFTITAKDVRFQIRVLHFLTAGLNNGTIAPDFIPRKVSSVRAWADVCNLLKVSGSLIDA